MPRGLKPKYQSQGLQHLLSKIEGVYDELVYYPLYQEDAKLWEDIKEVSLMVQGECNKAIEIYKGAKF